MIAWREGAFHWWLLRGSTLTPWTLVRSFLFKTLVNELHSIVSRAHRICAILCKTQATTELFVRNDDTVGGSGFFVTLFIRIDDIRGW